MDSYYNIIKRCSIARLVFPVPVKVVALITFTVTAIIYFVLPHICTLPLFGKVFVKCAPVFCLMWFVFLHMGSDRIGGNRRSKKIFSGLLFSCIGDALLNLDGMFIQGMVSFGIAQLLYISALGFDELNVRLGMIIYTMCALITPSLLPASGLLLRCCIPLYSFLLATMGWRSLAISSDTKSKRWNRLLVGAGGILWMVSDAALAYNEFNHAFAYANVIVMTTYYADLVLVVCNPIIMVLGKLVLCSIVLTRGIDKKNNNNY